MSEQYSETVVIVRPSFKCLWCEKEKPAKAFRKSKEGESVLRTQFCSSCYDKVNIKVRNHNKRATGILTISVWLKILEKSGGYCCYCKEYKGFASLSIEHIIPGVKNGTNDQDNIAAACKRCNNSKRGRYVEDWQRSQEAKRLLVELQNKLGLSKFETINEAIFTLAEKEGLIMEKGVETCQ